MPVGAAEDARGRQPERGAILRTPTSAEGTGRVVIGLEPAESAPVAQGVRTRGGVVLETHAGRSVAVVRPPAGEDAEQFAQEVSALPGVEYAEAEQLVYAASAPSDPYYPEQWGFARIGLPAARAYTTGSSAVTVAVLDTGIDFAHSDAPARIDTANDYDFVDGDSVAQDTYGHGTHVAGIIAAATNNGRGVAGLAPGVVILPVRVLGTDGLGGSAGVAQGIRWAADHGADIINMSLTTPDDSSVLRDACEYAVAKGCLVVAASGNGAAVTPGSIGFPARYPGVIAVGATTADDSRASYSQYGPALDIVAPGGSSDTERDGIVSLWLGNRVVWVSGTSMAAPHVAGTAALVRSVNPTWTAEMIEQCLLGTAQDLGTAGRDDQFGYGLVRADRAVAAAVNASDNEIPGVPASGGRIEGFVSASSDPHDVYSVLVDAGETVRATITSSQGTFALRLFGPSNPSVTDKPLADASATRGTLSYVTPGSSAGRHYLDIHATAGFGWYRVDYSVGVPTQVSIFAPSTVARTKSAQVTGVLTKPGGAAAPGRAVTVQHRPHGSTTWSTAGHATTSPDGRYSVKVWPKKQTEYRVVFSGVSGALFATTSGTKTITPKAYLTRPTAPSRIKKGASFTSTGYLRPRHTTGAKSVKIKAYRKVGGVYRYSRTYYAVNKYHTSVTTKYARKIKLPYRGKWKLVASVSGDTLHAATTSSARYLTVY